MLIVICKLYRDFYHEGRGLLPGPNIINVPIAPIVILLIHFTTRLNNEL